MKRLYPSYAPPEKWRNEAQSRKLEGAEWQSLRQRILIRDNYKCAYCRYKAEKFQIVDHIDGDPENNADNNLQILCQMCNLVKHSGQGCVLTGIVELYRNSWFSQTSLIILTRFLRDLGKSDVEIKNLLGLNEKAAFKMNREYLMPLFAFVTSRNTIKGGDMYDKWKKYHERVLRPQYREKDITARLKIIAPDEYQILRKKAARKIFNYIPELSDHPNRPIVDLLIKAGIFKEFQNKCGNPNSL